MKILLHACCGPCSLEPTRLLAQQNAQFTVFYSNSNIHPQEEYTKRWETLQTYAQSQGFAVVEDTYNAQEWEESAGRVGQKLEELRHTAGIDQELVKAPNPYPLPALVERGEEVEAAREEAAQLRAARCRACYRLRFEHAAAYAKENGFDALGTTLSVSPFQYTATIQEELERAAGAAGLTSAFVDYRPYFQAAEDKSRALGMYRQNYCGCHFSLDEANLERAIRKEARKAARRARKAAQAAQAAAQAAAQQAEQAHERAVRVASPNGTGSAAGSPSA